jgi:hypothetical protein
MLSWLLNTYKRESEITHAFLDCKISCVAYLAATAVLLFCVKCFVRILNMFFLDVGLHANRCTPGIMHSGYVVTCEIQDSSCEDICHNKVFMFSLVIAGKDWNG